MIFSSIKPILTILFCHRVSAKLTCAGMLFCSTLITAGEMTQVPVEIGTINISAIDTSTIAAQDRSSALSEGWQHGAFIEIFVRGYKDSNGDGIGDLKGLTQKLDYLHDLGIKGIWLMPITASADHDHGYATTDFRRLEATYGSMADFDELITEAHARGIGIIIDYVINHSAAGHPMFIQSASSTANPYRNWYVWQDVAPIGWDIWGKNPWIPTKEGAYFATFGFHMPDFNLRNPEVVQYHKDSLRFWLNRGLDGFRLDAVPHLIENNAADWNDQPESRALTHEFQTLINGYTRRYVVCEATANPQVYAAPDICGSAFAFGHEQNIIKAAKGDLDAIQKVADYFKTAPLTMATMLSNHDIFAGQRLWDQLRGNQAQYKLAAATYLLQPGTPFIYYGEEIGMAGVKKLKGDEPLRTPMSWTGNRKNAGFTTGLPFRPASPNAARQNAAREMTDAHSILSFYKTMLKLRNTLPSIAQGSYESPFVSGHVMAYQRKHGSEQTLVLTNYGGKAAKVKINHLPASASLKTLYPNMNSAHKLASNVSGEAVIRIKAQSVMVFLLMP